MLLLPGLCPPGAGGGASADVGAGRWVILCLLQEVKEGFSGEVSLELHFGKFDMQGGDVPGGGNWGSSSGRRSSGRAGVVSFP